MSIGIGGGGGIRARISVSCLSGISPSIGWDISKILCPREMSVLPEKLFASFFVTNCRRCTKLGLAVKPVSDVVK